MAVAVAHRGFGPGAELAALRAREAELCHRYDAFGSTVAAETGPADDDRDDGGVRMCPPGMASTIAELNEVRTRIAEVESRWW